MNLHRLLRQRADEGRPVRVGVIGTGKFGSMFLAQARTTTGLHLMAVADLDPERARAALTNTGWPAERIGAPSFAAAYETGATHVTDDGAALIAADGMDVVIDATGSPSAGLRHARLCVTHGRHMVNVTVEADAIAGPLIAREMERAGLVYSMAYGDQPAIVCEMVDWARGSGFEVVAAGKGTKYMPEYHASTPDTVWGYFGITPEAAAAGGMNPQMFNSFIDGTKSAIEMAAISNATGLRAPNDGLRFPPASVDELPTVLRPESDGGCLSHKGQVEVVTCVYRDGRPIPGDLRWGVYVVFEAPSDYTARCFGEYGMATDPSGQVSALYRPYHLIGLELGISVASAALRGEPTGAPTAFNSDVAAVAKRDLVEGDVLDGEGGYTVWGKIMSAGDSLARGALPLGLAHGLKVTRPVRMGEVVRWTDVEVDETDGAVRVRRDMEAAFAPERSEAAE